MITSGIAVVVTMTHVDGLFPILQKQLEAADIPIIVNAVKPTPWQELCSLGFRSAAMIDTINTYPDFEYFVFIDGWDMLFFGSKIELTTKLSLHTHAVVGAEKNLFPQITLNNPDRLSMSPWHHVNGGLVAGTGQQIIRFVQWMLNMCDPSMLDQEAYNRAMDNHYPPMYLDTQTSLCYNMYEDNGELVLKPRPFNYVSSSIPCFIHFNGKSDPSRIVDHYKLKEVIK